MKTLAPHAANPLPLLEPRPPLPIRRLLSSPTPCLSSFLIPASSSSPNRRGSRSANAAGARGRGGEHSPLPGSHAPPLLALLVGRLASHWTVPTCSSRPAALTCSPHRLPLFSCGRRPKQGGQDVLYQPPVGASTRLEAPPSAPCVFYLLVSAHGCPLTCSSSRAVALLVFNSSSSLVLMCWRSLHHC